MDFIVKLLFLGGKYISQAAGRTILVIYYRSKELGRHMSIQYEKASEIIKPYDNMLELLNDRAREETTEDDVHLAFMNDELKKQLEEHLKHIPMKIKSEQINELCKNDATSSEIKKEWNNVLVEESNEDTFASVDDSLISKDCEYDKMFTDLCKDLSNVTMKNFSENNCTSKVVEFTSMNIAFKTSQTYEVQESLKITPETINEPSKDDDLKPVVLEDLERKINASNIEVFQFNSSPKNQDETRFNMEYLKKYQKSGQNPLSSLYSKDASYMKYLVDQAPSNSYFNTNAIRDKNVKETDDFSNSKEQNSSSYVSDMQLPKNNFFNADEVIRINNRNIISGLHEEIENRMILLNKNKEHFKDFEKKLHDRLIKSKVKQTTTINKFDNKLESKLKRSINANMTLKRPLSSGNTANSKADSTETRNEFTKLLSVNEKQFQKLERKITQRLIRYGLNNADVMKINYKEIRRPLCKHTLSNTDKEDINERAKIMEINNKVFEKFEKDMRNIVILEKNKQMDEEDKLISDELGKYHHNMQKFQNQHIYDDKRRLRKLNKPQYVNVQSDFPHEQIKSKYDKKTTPSYSLKRNLSSADVEDIRARTGILETNAKAFDMFERRVNLSAAKDEGVSNNKTYDSDFHSTDVMKTLKDILDNSRIFKPPKSTQAKNINSMNKTGPGANHFAKSRNSIMNSQNNGNIPRYKSPTKKETKERQTLKGIGVMQEKSKNLQDDSKVKKQEVKGSDLNENSKQNLDDAEVKQYITKKHAKFTDFNLKPEDKNKDCNIPSTPKQTGDKFTKCKNQESNLVSENEDTSNSRKHEEMQLKKKKGFQKQFSEQCMSGKAQVTADDKSRETQIMKQDPIREEKAKDNNQMKYKQNLSEELLEEKIRCQNIGDKVKSNSTKEIKDIQSSKIPRIQPVQIIIHDCQNTSEIISNKRGVKGTKSENNIKMSENCNVAPVNKENKSIKGIDSKQSENTRYTTNKITNKRSVSVPLRTYENKSTLDLLNKYSKSHNKTVEHTAIKTKSRINDDKKVTIPLTRPEKVEDERLKNYSKIQHASHNILQALDTIEKGTTSCSKKDTSKLINQNNETIIDTSQKRIEDGKVDSNIRCCDERNNLSESFASNMKTKATRVYNGRIKPRSQSVSFKSLDVDSEIDNYEMLENMPKRKIENTKVVTRQVKSTSQLETFSSQSKLSGKKINLTDTKIAETRIPTYTPRNKRDTIDTLNVAKPTIKTQEVQNNENKQDIKNTINKESPKADVHKSKLKEIEVAKVLESIENLTKEKRSNNQTSEATNTVLTKALQLLQELEHFGHTNKSSLANAKVKSTTEPRKLPDETDVKHHIPPKVNKCDIKLKQPGFITKLSKGNISNIGGGEAGSEGDNSGKMGGNRGGNESSDGVRNLGKIRLKKIIAFVPADEETLEDLQKHCDKDHKSSINENGYCTKTYKRSAEKNIYSEANRTDLNVEKSGLKPTVQDVENKTTNGGAIKQKFSFIPLRDSSEPKNDRSSSSRINKQNDGINSSAVRTDSPVNATQYDNTFSDEQTSLHIVKRMKVGQTSVDAGSTKNIERNQPLNTVGKKKQPIENYKTQNQTEAFLNEKCLGSDESTKTAKNNIKSELDERQLIANQTAYIVKPRFKSETSAAKNKLLEESENEPPQRYIDYKVLNQMKDEEKEVLVSSGLTSEERSKSLQESISTEGDNTPQSKAQSEINTEDTQNYKEKESSTSMSALPFRMAKFSFIPLKIEKCKNAVELPNDTIHKPKNSEENVFQEQRTKVESRIKSEEREPNEGSDVELYNLALQVSKKVQAPVEKKLQRKKTIQKHIFVDENTRKKVLTFFSETERERKERLKTETFLEKLKKDISSYSKIPTLKQNTTVSQEVKYSNDSNKDQIKRDKETDSHLDTDGEVQDISETIVETKNLTSSSKPKFLFREAKFLFIPLKKVHYADPDDVQEEVVPQEDVKVEIVEPQTVEDDLFPEAMSPLLRYFMRKQLRKKVYKAAKVHKHHVQENARDNYSNENLSGTQVAFEKLSYTQKQQSVAAPNSEKIGSIYERYPLLLKHKRNPTPNKIPRGALEWKLKFAQQMKLKQHANKNVENHY